jgi:acyl-CoA synthetase (NDP forming)/L-amino acid N-acyltransferase YncA
VTATVGGAGVDALAADGRVVHIRPVLPSDVEALRHLHTDSSAENRYYRFFTQNPTAAENYAHRLGVPDPARIALVAERDGEILAVASAHDVDTPEPEVAFLVRDTAHGTGLGTLLLEHLAAAVRPLGVHRFRAEVLSTNRAMLGVFRDSGFAEHVTNDGYTTAVELDLDPQELTLNQIADRERRAEQESLRRVLAPRSVAVIGASRRPGAIGHALLQNIVAGGFTGSVYPVNPNATEVCGRRCYPRMAAVPGPIDLAVLAVPAAAVRDAVEECCRAGVGGIVITTAGFAELGDAGRATQRELVRLTRAAGIRLIGPNCLGVLNTAPDIHLNATFAPLQPASGGLSLASQSGAVGIGVLDHATRTGAGIAQFVSLGNKADVSGNDLVQYWWRDPATRVICLYLESFGNPLKFARIARRVGADKPLLVVKGGRSTGGARGGSSHTAAAATPEAVLAALFAQSGVIRLDSLPEMMDVARVLVDQPLPRGGRLGIVGNAGGAGILAADAAEAAGLEVPTLGPDTRTALCAMSGTAVENPVDLGAGADPSGLAEAVATLARSNDVDAVLAIVAATGTNDVTAALRAIARVSAAHPDVPVLAACLGVPDLPGTVENSERRVPVFEFGEEAARAWGRIAAYARWRRTPRGTVPDLDRVDLPAARAVVKQFLADQPEGGWLPHSAALDLAGAVGLPMVRSVSVTGPRLAADAARALGFPVALKTAAPAVVHKTDVGGVRLALDTPAKVRSAYVEVAAATHDARAVVQPMVTDGVEMIVGLTRDPLFGPVVMLGSGGVLTELLDDRAWRGLPLTDADADAMVASLRGARLLAGFRGSTPADVPALLDVLHRVARLGEALPEVAELDLNPVIAGPHGATVVDVRIRVAAAVGPPDPVLRRLP